MSSEVEKLQHRIDELELELMSARKQQAIGIVASGLAHDVNNSLAAISGFTDLLRRKFDNVHEDVSRYASEIQKSCARASGQIEKLKDFTRKDRSHIQLFNIHDSLTELSDIIDHTLGKRFQFNWDLGAAHHLWRGDSSMLQSSILHMLLLMRNILPEGGKITIRTSNLRVDQLALDIVSTDSRLDSELLKKSMDHASPYSSAVRLLQRITERQGGELHLAQIQETTWRLRIVYFLEVLVDAEQRMEEDTLGVIHAIQDQVQNKERKLCILDDDAIVLQMLTHVAKHQSFVVNPFPSYKSLVASDCIKEFSHILVDLHLADEDGEEVAKALKKQYANTEIGVMSGDLPMELKAELNKHAIMCFDKPFDMSLLKKWLNPL